jgi:hypothetical protein
MHLVSFFVFETPWIPAIAFYVGWMTSGHAWDTYVRHRKMVRVRKRADRYFRAMRRRECRGGEECFVAQLGLDCHGCRMKLR